MRMKPLFPHSSKASRRSQRGASLLEVMIAVIVLSFGLLGLAGLQVTSLRNNQSAMERSLAVVHSYTILDAMRADRNNATTGAFNLGLEDDAPSGSSFAATQLAEWRTLLTETLGEGASGSVNCNGADCTVIIRWNDERGLDGSATQNLSTQAQL